MNLSSSEAPMPFSTLFGDGKVFLQVEFSPKIDRSPVNLGRNYRDLGAVYKDVSQLQRLQMRNW